jgi:regulator of nucleoside diphosphate kinase
MDWLEDEDVTRFLSDSRHVSRLIEQVIGRVQLPILTHLFNQGGRFFMAYDRHDVPVGFVRLVKSGRDCEMVLVIGDRDNWGRKLGASAIREAMKLAFFEMRAARLIAKIHPENVRSLNAFLRSGFLPESETPAMKSLVMSSARYLRLLRERPAVHTADIVITEIDKARLRNLIDLEQGPDIFELEHEIERAIVVDPQKVAEDVITMNSKALLRWTTRRWRSPWCTRRMRTTAPGNYPFAPGSAPRSSATRRATPSAGGCRTEPAGSGSAKCSTSRKRRAISTSRPSPALPSRRAL